MDQDSLPTPVPGGTEYKHSRPAVGPGVPAEPRSNKPYDYEEEAPLTDDELAELERAYPAESAIPAPEMEKASAGDQIAAMQAVLEESTVNAAPKLPPIEIIDDSPPVDAPETAAPEGADAPITDEELIAMQGLEGPEGLLSTYGGRSRPDVIPQAESGLVLTGLPQRYVVVRTRNRGMVIDAKWQRLSSIEAVLAVIESEREAGYNGTLFYGAITVAKWGDGPPARV